MIETKRLQIKPLTYEQLEKYIRNDNSLEDELNLSHSSREISPELKEAFEETILPGMADKSKNYLYSTIWTIIHMEQNLMVGDLCFYGEPNENGEIELGYGTHEAFRGMGYMTEAVGGIIEWADQQPAIKAINASTEQSNPASYTILENNNFQKAGESDTLYLWHLKLK